MQEIQGSRKKDHKSCSQMMPVFALGGFSFQLDAGFSVTTLILSFVICKMED